MTRERLGLPRARESGNGVPAEKKSDSRALGPPAQQSWSSLQFSIQSADEYFLFLDLSTFRSTFNGSTE
jgi:hypothetical protein